MHHVPIFSKISHYAKQEKQYGQKQNLTISHAELPQQISSKTVYL
jgi:hypothetical protein